MRRTTLAVLALLSICLAGVAQGTQEVSTPMQMPVHLTTDATASGCDNSPGPTITLQGAIALGGLGVELVFQNNLKGTHTYDYQTTVKVEVVPQGETLQIPKQPVLGGVGGNPFIWVQFMDSHNKALTSEIYLGRCVQGFFHSSADFSIPSTASATISSDSCDNTGSTITLSGELSLSGINARLVFRNNDNPVGGPHQNDQPTTVNIVLIPAGQSVTFAKQPPLGGVGGNPWISLVFLDGKGQPASDTFLLGRCVKL